MIHIVVILFSGLLMLSGSVKSGFTLLVLGLVMADRVTRCMLPFIEVKKPDRPTGRPHHNGRQRSRPQYG